MSTQATVTYLPETLLHAQHLSHQQAHSMLREGEFPKKTGLLPVFSPHATQSCVGNGRAAFQEPAHVVHHRRTILSRSTLDTLLSTSQTRSLEMTSTATTLVDDNLAST